MVREVTRFKCWKNRKNRGQTTILMLLAARFWPVGGALAMGCSRPKTESMEFWADELMSVSGAKAVTGKPRVQSIMKWTVSDVSAVSLNQQLSIVKYHPRH